MRIGLTYDLRQDYLAAGFSEEETAEFDRPDTIAAIATALAALGHEPVRIGNIRALVARLAAGERWDLVFTIAEGLYGFGREAQIPALLEAYAIPYTFSDTLTCALTLHKAMAKHVVSGCGIATPAFALIESVQDIDTVTATLALPLFAKPVAEGTSKGIDAASKITSPQQLHEVCAELLQRHRQPVLVETYLAGREFTVGITGSGDQASVIGILEVTLRAAAGSDVYSYLSKEHYETLVDYHLLPADDLARQIAATALHAWRALGCRDGGRIDLRMDEHQQLHFLEANPLAGLHPQRSDLPIMCNLAGIPYIELIRRIVDSALQRASASQQLMLPVAA
jgi:D-alanine-D-alanine ligase